MRIVYFILMALVCSCTNENEPDLPCTGDHPVTALDWLQNEIEYMKENAAFYEFQYITRARYGFKTVFLIRNCCPNCLSVVPVFDCSGNNLGILGGEIKASNILGEEMVWQAENSGCLFN